MTFKTVRVSILLSILVAVSFATYQQTHLTTSWKKPLKLTLYPINGANSKKVQEYIDNIETSTYQAIELFLGEEAKHYNLGLTKLIDISIGKQLDNTPPNPPGRAGTKIDFIKWSLGLRWWLYKNVSSFGLESSHIRLFVIYHPPIKNKPLAHSYGLQKGLVGVVHAFASEPSAGSNNVVIVHELLHILGATDKYDSNLKPIYPHGFAEPDKTPAYPQEYAEIMGGRIPLSPQEAVIPDSLDLCLIGPQTALEINWQK